MNIEKFVNEELGEEMQFVRCESGLKVYVFPKKGFNKYYAIYGTEYGSIDKTFKIPGEEEMTTVPDGIAHYLEHKMFEDENGGNAFDKFAETGASSNAFTSFDITAYLFSCTDKFYENLDILLDFVNKPYFTEENVKKEQGIIGQEIKMYDDEPEWRVFFNTISAMFHENPVKTDIAGTVESIAKITPEYLYKCYNTFYNPANMMLVLVGDIDVEKVMEYVDKHISAERNLGEIERLKVDEPTERVKEFAEEELDVSIPIFRIGFKDNRPGMTGDELLKKELETEIILEAVLGSSTDLYLDMYEKGLINQSFGFETEFEHEYGYSLIGGEADKPNEIYEIIKAAFKKHSVYGIDNEPIDRAKKVLIADNIRLFNSVDKMGNVFIKQLMNKQNPLEFRKVVESITYEDIHKRLVEHFDIDNCVLSVVKPIQR